MDRVCLICISVEVKQLAMLSRLNCIKLNVRRYFDVKRHFLDSRTVEVFFFRTLLLYGNLTFQNQMRNVLFMAILIFVPEIRRLCHFFVNGIENLRDKYSQTSCIISEIFTLINFPLNICNLMIY